MSKENASGQPLSPFPVTWNPDTTAVLCWSRNLQAYAEGYLQASRLLADAVLEGRHVPKAFVHDSVFPIAFLYRHYVELRLKELALTARECLWKRAVGDGDPGLRDQMKELQVPDTHDLWCLWRVFLPLLARLRPDPGNEVSTRVSRRIRALADADPKGESFRYPFTSRKQGRAKTLGGIERLDVAGIKTELDALAADLEEYHMETSAHWEVVEEGYRESIRYI
jgi:hypothetical protein